MANSQNAGISAEAQHVINSLEAHFAAVRAAVASTDAELIARVETAWTDVLERLSAWGAKFSGSTAGAETPDAPPADPQTPSASEPTTGAVGSSPTSQAPSESSSTEPAGASTTA